MLNLENLLKKMGQYIPGLNGERVKQAYELANKYSPDINIIFNTLETLLELKPDENSVIVCFLETIWTKKEHREEILKNFEPDIIELLRNLNKVNSIKIQFSQEEQIDNLRKLFLVMANDIRVVLIHLAYRLSILRNIENIQMEDKKFFVKEVLQIYSPIASRLGIYNFKIELENLAFKFLHPEKYTMLTKELSKYIKKRQQSIDEIKKILEEILKKHSIEGLIKGRIKHPYSIYQKLKRKDKIDLNDIFDIFAVRIILPDKETEKKEGIGHCYEVLGLIHKYFTPIESKFKDYISVPKSNGYRSLHTTVLGLGEKSKDQPTEIQIRTESMHKESEYGISSHWCYEDLNKKLPKIPAIQWQKIMENQEKLQLIEELLNESVNFKFILENWKQEKNNINNEFLQNTYKINKEDIEQFLNLKLSGIEKKYPIYRQISWLKGLTKLQDNIEQNGEIKEKLPVDMFKDRIFVLTPNGEIKDLPKDSTPIDFAYAIHTDIGHSCHQAKVNGEIIPLNYHLKNGQVVEILTKKNKEPNRYWLSLVKTHMAKSKIKSWFKEQDKEVNIKEGKLLLNTELAKLGKPLLTPNLDIFKIYNGEKLNRKEREEILEDIGNGIIPVNTVLKKLFSARELAIHRTQRKIEKSNLPEIKEDEILIIGEKGLPIKKSSCCNPRLSDKIIGYVTRGKGISIHNKNCGMLKNLDPKRLVEAEWSKNYQNTKYSLNIRLKTNVGDGIITNIVKTLSEMNINILQFTSSDKSESIKFFNLALEVLNTEQIETILENLKTISGVLNVDKTNEQK